jgi:hypothetical protein
MQWRRRAVLIMALAATVLCALFVLTFGSQVHVSNEQLRAAGASIDEVQRQFARGTQPTISIVMLMILLLMQITTSDLIPLDRQHHVKELLDASPLPVGVYLLGKVLGMCLVSWVCFGGTMIVIGVLWWALMGAYDLGIYLSLWAVIAVLFLTNPGIAILLAAGQPNRRRAIAVGGTFTAICIYLMTRFESAVTFWELLNPARLVILKYYMLPTSGTSAIRSVLPVAFSDVLLSLVAGLCEVGLVGIGTWLWLRRGNREEKL